MDGNGGCTAGSRVRVCMHVSLGPNTKTKHTSILRLETASTHWFSTSEPGPSSMQLSSTETCSARLKVAKVTKHQNRRCNQAAAARKRKGCTYSTGSCRAACVSMRGVWHLTSVCFWRHSAAVSARSIHSKGRTCRSPGSTCRSTPMLLRPAAPAPLAAAQGRCITASGIMPRAVVPQNTITSNGSKAVPQCASSHKKLAPHHTKESYVNVSAEAK